MHFQDLCAPDQVQPKPEERLTLQLARNQGLVLIELETLKALATDQAKLACDQRHCVWIAGQQSFDELCPVSFALEEGCEVQNGRGFINILATQDALGPGSLHLLETLTRDRLEELLKLDFDQVESVLQQEYFGRLPRSDLDVGSSFNGACDLTVFLQLHVLEEEG
jgi:hypothetical protein